MYTLVLARPGILCEATCTALTMVASLEGSIPPLYSLPSLRPPTARSAAPSVAHVPARGCSLTPAMTFPPTTLPPPSHLPPPAHRPHTTRTPPAHHPHPHTPQSRTCLREVAHAVLKRKRLVVLLEAGEARGVALEQAR